MIGAVAAAFVGCGRAGPVTVPLTGEVSYRGVPVEHGVIRFVPEPGTLAPASVALIADGRYRATARGGLQPGTYRVEIEAFRSPPEPAAAGPVADAGLHELVGPQYLPARYHEATELRLTVDGSSRGGARHDFHLEQ